MEAKPDSEAATAPLPDTASTCLPGERPGSSRASDRLTPFEIESLRNEARQDREIYRRAFAGK